ncbi:hypothetical protein [Shewanella woodyi]|uniref:Uncharacterized protein n=1 Tax=Shewanella woodyi (strain ATCC 51908 / MS32) TaxID=392500 RepID=B1KGD3_SHEWM|nr:hypothetical protein [Shewanella woodyi]ACA88270.1 conserved hypothetical protein [Shewanella woodyi ATCC 51908]
MAKPSLSTTQVRQIEKILYRWSGKLTWEELVDQLENELEITTTRQTLNSYSSISGVFKSTKTRLRGISENYQNSPNVSLEKASLLDKIEKLENEIIGLRTQNQQFQGLLNDIRMEAESTPLLMDLLISVKRKHQG